MPGEYDITLLQETADNTNSASREQDSPVTRSERSKHESYYGRIRTHEDVEKLFGAAQAGFVPTVQGKLSLQGQRIRPGSVFIWVDCKAEIPVDGKSWCNGTQKTRFSCEFREQGTGSEIYLVKRVYCLPTDRLLLISYDSNLNALELPQPTLDPDLKFCEAFNFDVSIFLLSSLLTHL